MSLLIGLSVVIVGYSNGTPQILTNPSADEVAALPFGAFDPDRHRTFELALRGWVKEQTGYQLGYVEQLYTFGDRNRESMATNLFETPAGTRIVSVGYLALTPQAQYIPEGSEARWHGWYQHFPWEDHRSGRPPILDDIIIPHLEKWAGPDPDRLSRLATAFATDSKEWIDEAVLERYELLYEAGLVLECARDRELTLPSIRLGDAMASDHRRILATAMSRLRSKIRYRPIVFELMNDEFTLSALQTTVEAVLGQPLHKQNFRRGLDRSGLVVATGRMRTQTGGRPAALFRFAREDVQHGTAKILSIPVIKS